MNPVSAVTTADLSFPRRSDPIVPSPEKTASPRTLPVAILGVPFDAVSTSDALARIDAMIASRRPHYVVTANVDFLVQAQRDVELRRILIDADLVLCDGTPLLWASRWLGNALPERVAGSDLTPQLLAAAAARGYRVFFLGAGPGVAADAAARLTREYPALQVVGHYSPPLSALLEMDHGAILDRIRATAPDILLVSFGCPKQEKWIAMHYAALGVPVCIGVGATLDFLAGRVKRAPAWMRRTGCEWLFRLIQEPRRLYRRYAMDACGFVPALASQWWRMGRRRAVTGKLPTRAEPTQDFESVDAGLALTRETLELHGAHWHALPERDGHCIVDVSRVRHIDAAGVAFLIKWRKALRQRSCELVLVGSGGVVWKVLRALRVSDCFHFAASTAEASMLIGSTAEPSVVVRDGSLEWRGEITVLNAAEVWEKSSDCITAWASGATALVSIDLAQVRFIDSSAAGMMLRLKKWAHGLHTEVLFVNPQPNVANVLRLARLDHLLLEGGQ